jgi:hypothetical protein
MNPSEDLVAAIKKIDTLIWQLADTRRRQPTIDTLAKIVTADLHGPPSRDLLLILGKRLASIKGIDCEVKHENKA